jgi:transcriptional regulator with XRE-family HTH domain
MAYIRTTKQFIAQIKQARIDKGLTQTDLGNMVGMTQKKIAMIENLTASPRLDVLLVITSALGLNISIDQDSNISGRNKTNKKVNLIWE